MLMIQEVSTLILGRAQNVLANNLLSLLLPPASPLLTVPLHALARQHAWDGAVDGSPLVPPVRPQPAPSIPPLPPPLPASSPAAAAALPGQVCHEPALRRLQRGVRPERAAGDPRGQRALALDPPGVRGSQSEHLALPTTLPQLQSSSCKSADSREVLVRLGAGSPGQEISPTTITSPVVETFPKSKSFPCSQVGGDQEALRGEQGLWDRSDERLPAGVLPCRADLQPADPVHGEGAADGVEQAVRDHR